MEKPRLLQGFRDWLPEQMRARQRIVDTAKKVYESYGFEPLDTPALEYADLLMGKYGEDEKLIYNFKDHGDRHVAMRYDLTVPLARVVSSYQHLPKPFKRYQVGTVWRADSPQAGRYREFMQLDADTIGSASPLADAEMLVMTANIYQALGLKNFTIQVNHRGVLSALLKVLDVSQTNTAQVLRSIDKLAKAGERSVREQLKSLMPEQSMNQLFELFQIQESEGVVDHLRLILKNADDLELLEQFAEILQLADAPSSNIQVNLSVVRGLDYYTGLIYEVALKDASVGSVGSGGRYDDLMQQLSGQDLPAIGTSLGVDRLLAAIGETTLVDSHRILVAVFPGFEKQAFDLAEELRRDGLSVALGLGSEKLGKQMQYADAIGAQYALLYGDNEAARDCVLVRDMKSGEQKEVKREELSAELKKF